MAPPDRRFTTLMFIQLFLAACQFRRNNELVLFQELVNTPSLLLEVATNFNQKKTTCPSRTWKEVHAELIKINSHWKDLIEIGEDMSWWIKHPALWINNSHKDEDIFMPSTKVKKAA
jgi:hypothetical protein